MAEISLETAKKIQEAWPDSSSLEDAMKNAGLKTRDSRRMHRNRRAAENLLNIELPAHNEQFSTYKDISCPSTLDIKKAKKSKSFVITSCVNNSPVADRFFDALSLFCADKKSQFLVVPMRYKNPNAVSRNEDYWWDKRIHEFVLKDDFIVNKNLVISANRLSATLLHPLSGLRANSGARSAIYGHPQLSMQMVATPKDETAKMIHTTGAISRPRYSSSGAGAKAHFNHSFAALYVKVVGNKFYTTQLVWDNKSSTFNYGKESWNHENMEIQDVEAIVKGDSHVIAEEKIITKARDRVCKLTNPKIHVWHDVFDANSISHHSTLFSRIKNSMNGQDCLETELKITADHISKHGGDINWIIDSNHDRHIERYISEGRDRKDPKNVIIASELLSGSVKNKVSCLEYYFSQRIPNKYKFISANKKALVKGIDLSQHGDRGANGARGSIKGFANLAAKTVSGHSHQPGIEKGSWQVGTSTMSLGYAQGYSSWAYADCLIYQNGKRAMVMYIDGKSIFDV